MSQELHYTSAPRGLKPGSRGFATVAATANLPEALADRLEGLSAYQAVYAPGDPSAALNPIAYVHVRLTVGGQVQDVLSRIGPAGLDYSGRPNKYAHHVVLGPDERPEGGPAWLVSQPGFFRKTWEGEPRILSEGSLVRRGDRPPGIAETWRALTGDAGWAGVLAEAFLADPRRPVFLVFRPGMELLPLFVEGIALLPVSRRWDVEFSTYLTSLPPGISCAWRGVLEGSAQAKGARRLPHALVLDLCRHAGLAQGGSLVHLARTGERLETLDAGVPASPGARQTPLRPPAITAGPAPRSRTAGPERAPDGAASRDGLPDLAARLVVDESLLGDDGSRRRRRSRTLIPALLIAACLLPLLAAGFYWSPRLRRRPGLGPVRPAVTSRPDPADRISARPEKPRDIASPDLAGGSEAPAPARPPNEKVAKHGGAPAAEKKAVAKDDSSPVARPKPNEPAPRPPAEPLLLAFATPDVPRSSLGSSGHQERDIRLPEETDDRVEILNGPEFRLAAVPAAPHAWELATRSGSGLGGGFSLARLDHADARTWRFQWSQSAKVQSTQVENLKDAILSFHGRDGRPIRVLLRGVETLSDRPLVVWKDQQILFEKLDTRIRSVEWVGNPDVLEGTHWKPRIRRWKLVLSRGDANPGGADSPRRVIEPAPGDGEMAQGAEPALERDLVPGEVKVKLMIDPSRPGSIDVRIEPVPERVREGKADRSAQMDELRKATPRAEDGSDRDPLVFRRAKLDGLRGRGAKDQEEIKSLEREIGDLKRINEIRETEDLLTRPARVELSVVIGLEVDGQGILDIVKIGEFAGGR
jgi:hypothetical protein